MEYNNNDLLQGSNVENNNTVSFNFNDSQNNTNTVYFGNDYNGQNVTNNNMQNNNFQNNLGNFQSNDFQTINNQDTTVFNNYQNNVFEPERKKSSGKKVFLVILLLIIILSVICVFAVSSLKSDEQRFLELLTTKQEFVKLEEDLNQKALKAEQVNTIVEIDFDKFADSIGEDIDGELNLALEMKNINKDNNQYGMLNLLVNNERIIPIEYAKTGEIYGIKVAELTEKFIAIENKDLQDMLENFGVEDVDEMPNKILTKEDFEKVIKLNEDELAKILIKYVNTFSKLCEEKIIVEKDGMIKINDKEYKTTKYSLEITEKFLYDMCVALMEELKDDKKSIAMFLDDMKAILEVIEENGYDIEEMYDMSIDDIPSVEEVCEELEKAYEELKEVEIEELDSEEVIMTISVHDYKGRNIATEATVADQTVRIKCINDKDIILAIEVEEDEDIVEFLLKGNNGKDKFEMECLIFAEDIELELFKLKQEYMKKAEKDVRLSKENALILNDITEEELEDFVEEIEENFEDFVKDIEEKIEEIPALEELIVGMMGNSTDTISHANYAAFCMNMGELSDQIMIDAAALKAEHGIAGEICTNAQIYYEIATGKKPLKDEQIPNGEKFNFDFLDTDEVCYEFDLNNITVYEKTKNLYGLENEKYYITSEGHVFTLPGFKEEQYDGEIWYYVDGKGNYYLEGEDFNKENDKEVIEDDYEWAFDEEIDSEDENIMKDNSDFSDSKNLIAKAQKIYKDIEKGATKEEIIRKAGKPSNVRVSELDKKFEILEWNDGNTIMVSVDMYDGEFRAKHIELESNKRKNIYIGKDLNVEIEDLNKVITQVKEGMSLQKVMMILGSTGFETSIDDWGNTSYMWYDKKEQSVTVHFDEQGEAYYVGIVMESW